jgi:hypothetical protein
MDKGVENKDKIPVLHYVRITYDEYTEIRLFELSPRILDWYS